MIEAQHLSKSFGNRQAIRDLTFRAMDGAITGLLGPNGAGKTTTLRVIGGVLHPDAGSVVADGEPRTRDPGLRQRHIGALLDHRGLYARLSARENLEYFGQLRGMPDERLKARIEEIVRALDLRAIIDRRTAGFSDGEALRTALGRALLHSPRNVILDEVTNGLDVLAVRALRDLLTHFRDVGNCVLFSSHVLAEVQLLCDRVIILANGRVVAQGTITEVCDQTGSRELEEAFIKLTSGRKESQ